MVSGSSGAMLTRAGTSLAGAGRGSAPGPGGGAADGAADGARLAAWEALLARHRAAPTAFPLAVGVHERHHPRGRNLLLTCGDGLVSAGVTLRTTQLAGLTLVRSAGEPGTPVAVPADDVNAAERFAACLADTLRRRRGGWALHLGPLPADAAVVAALQRHLPGVVVHPGHGVPCLDVGAGADPRERVSRNTRAAERRTEQRAARAGQPVERVWHRSGAAVRARLPEIVEVHRRRNRQVRGRAGLDDPAQARYFADVVASHADAGRADVLTVDVAGRLAAFAVCLRGGDVAYVYANLVDPAFLPLGAGTYANAAVVRHHLEQPWCQVLNWGPGVQRYKLSGGAEVVPTVVLEAWSGAPVRSLLRGAARLRSAARRLG